MNTYRVTFLVDNRRRAYDVDATTPGTAINQALRGFTNPTTTDIDVSCRLFARQVTRDWNDPKVREVS